MAEPTATPSVAKECAKKTSTHLNVGIRYSASISPSLQGVRVNERDDSKGSCAHDEFEILISEGAGKSFYPGSTSKRCGTFAANCGSRSTTCNLLTKVRGVAYM